MKGKSKYVRGIKMDGFIKKRKDEESIQEGKRKVILREKKLKEELWCKKVRGKQGRKDYMTAEEEVKMRMQGKRFSIRGDAI